MKRVLVAPIELLDAFEERESKVPIAPRFSMIDSDITFSLEATVRKKAESASPGDSRARRFFHVFR